ncbi:uncharacterized protein UV8b_06175 [Ustilaginoidea virens]|uniref:Pentatricopeptide repeat protein n=1 Tax=Ustilaginoidea virens TaxID=1159556 RepID=A0A8E5HUN9_USTVR|nr:uncharacterized protein UV8b_06175 [Ustilaginoidea virens]QUC21934.1 hypothetical protein UV8b_06175 [Ustilaginoidea virens]
MQSLWSRAGQASRCGCRFCSTTVGAVRQRAAGTRGRRNATIAEIFAACYSSVFATATLIDAVRKDGRRRELDRQLDEARRELHDLHHASPRQPAPETKPSDLSIHQMRSLWEVMKTIYRNRPFMKEIHKPPTVGASELIKCLKEQCYNAPGEGSLRAMRQTDYEQLENLAMADELNGQIGFREAQNQVQLLRESSSVEKLVHKLLDRAEIQDENSPAAASFDEARHLATNGFPKFTFRSMDPDRARTNTLALNQHIRALIGSKNMTLKEMIGRVCYNLLVSVHPPDMHTYNTLIVAFDKAGRHGFSDAIVHSFFHQRLLKPTPSTFTAILNHFKATNNHGRFLRAIACITGVDQLTGGKVRRRHMSDIERNATLQSWAADTTLRTHTGHWVWEHVPLDLHLVEAVLGGLLHFKLFDDAATFFVTCMRTGVALSSRLIKQVFDECLAALDWRAAVGLVRGLADGQDMWQALLAREDDTTVAYLAEKALALVDLCGLNDFSQEPSRRALAGLDISGPNLQQLSESLAKFNHALPAASSHRFPGPNSRQGADAVSKSKSRLLQLESLWKECDLVIKTTMSIESKLLYADFSPSFRSSMAQLIATKALDRSMELAHECRVALSSGGNLPPSTASCIIMGI